MANINNVVIIGNLTRDIELSNVGGKSLAKVSIAVNGFKKDDVSYIDITIWDKLADLCFKYLKKGSTAAFSGSLKQDRWKDKEGNPKSKIHIIARDVQFLNSKSSQESPTSDPLGSAMAGRIEDNVDDVPF